MKLLGADSVPALRTHAHTSTQGSDRRGPVDEFKSETKSSYQLAQTRMLRKSWVTIVAVRQRRDEMKKQNDVLLPAHWHE
jgi:hypothetical protein